MTTYSVTTTTGAIVTRTTEATYVAAAESTAGKVTFHKTQTAARRAAGKHGTVHAITAPATACAVCDGEGTYVVGPKATTGAFDRVTCHACGGTGVKA